LPVGRGTRDLSDPYRIEILYGFLLPVVRRLHRRTIWYLRLWRCFWWCYNKWSVMTQTMVGGIGCKLSECEASERSIPLGLNPCNGIYPGCNPVACADIGVGLLPTLEGLNSTTFVVGRHPVDLPFPFHRPDDYRGVIRGK
jgi:hypothetical protein